MITGFSKLTKIEKINYISSELFNGSPEVNNILSEFWHNDSETQKILEEFSENTISNFHFPYGVVPNFNLNGRNFIIPMVIEESSVVAALSKAAKFWQARGGFKARIIDTQKVGQVHFTWSGDAQRFEKYFSNNKTRFLEHAYQYTKSMEKRGGGILDIHLKDFSALEENYFQLFVTFETCDAMGANFINTVLEALGKFLAEDVKNNVFFNDDERDVEIIMCILSNLTPNCRVEAWVECSIDELNEKSLGMSPKQFASKFKRAVKIAQIDTYRATTHNKGIFNGIDGVVLATGNDFRAVEACGHAYAASTGHYKSLTNVIVDEDVNTFRFSIELPIALGTVGGLTSLHPLAKLSLRMLDNPSARELMMICASVGLAQNFAALKSLVTSGIQRGHMKMHLMNILNQLGANDYEKNKIKNDFKDKIVSYNDVKNALLTLRDHH